MVSFGDRIWGRLGKRFLKSGLKRQFLGKKRAFEAVFQNSDLPLTPSFVGSNPATPAIRRYILWFLDKETQNMASFFLLFSQISAICGVKCGVKCGVNPQKRNRFDAASFCFTTFCFSAAV